MLLLPLHLVYCDAFAFHLELRGCRINQVIQWRYLEAVILSIEAQYAENESDVCELAVYVVFAMLADAIYSTCYVQSATLDLTLNLTSQDFLRSPIHTC